MIRKLLPLTSALCLAALLVAQDVQPANGLSSPEEALAYIRGLSQYKLYDECATQAKDFLTRYPAHPCEESVEAWRIEALFALQRYKEVAPIIMEHLRKFPETKAREGFLYCLGECLRYTGDYEGARPAYEDMLKTAKGSRAEEARYRLALCLMKLQRKEEARKHLEILAALEPDAKEEHLPRIYARHYLAVQMQEEGNPRGALELLQPTLSLKGLPADLRKELLKCAALLAYQAPIQDFQMAENLYGICLTEFPTEEKDATLRKNLLLCHYALKHYAEFLELLEKERRDYPESQQDDDLKYFEALATVALGRHSQALPLLQYLLDNGTLSTAKRQYILQYLLFSLETLKKDEELVVAAKLYYQEFPAALDAQDVLLMAAGAEERLGKNDEAIADLEDLLPHLAGGDPMKYLQTGMHLAQFQAQCGDLAKAIALYLELGEKAQIAGIPENSQFSRKAFREASLLPLSQLPGDPRGFVIARQLADAAQDPAERLKFLQHTFNFASQAQKTQEALGIINEILPLVTPIHQPGWLLRRAELHRQLQDFPALTDDYKELMDHRETTPQIKADILPTLVSLLYYAKDFQQAQQYLEPLLTMDPPPEISEGLLKTIAMERLNAGDGKIARFALQRLLKCKTLSENSWESAAICLAKIEFTDRRFPQARTLLDEVCRKRECNDLTPHIDAVALLAEIALQEEQPELALKFAKQAFQGQGKPLFPESIPRARWAMAQAFLELEDLSNAFLAASQGFILENDSLYAPRCYLVAAQAKDQAGDTQTAAELRKAMQEKFPTFIP